MTAKQKVKKVKIIAHKDDMQNYHIGHSDSDMKTLVPEFVQEHKSTVNFGDIPGFNDQSSPIYNLYTNLIMKLILSNA